MAEPAVEYFAEFPKNIQFLSVAVFHIPHQPTERAKDSQPQPTPIARCQPRRLKHPWYVFVESESRKSSVFQYSRCSADMKFRPEISSRQPGDELREMGRMGVNVSQTARGPEMFGSRRHCTVGDNVTRLADHWTTGHHVRYLEYTSRCINQIDQSFRLVQFIG